MKFKRIKDEKDLKAGTYIRACYTRSGNPCTEVIRLAGRPYTLKSGNMKGYRVIDRFGKYPRANLNQREEQFVDDAIGHNNRKYNTVILIPFTNKALNYLKSLSGNEFINAINNGRLTDGDMSDIKQESYWDSAMNDIDWDDWENSTRYPDCDNYDDHAE